MNYLLVLFGLALLFGGGEALVRGAVALAQRVGLSPLLIGLTVVGFGTSSPELLVSVQAALDNQPDIALGNVIGSNIANILLILGVTAVIYPIRCKPQVVFRDGMTVIAVSILLVVLAFSGTLGFWHGLLMVAGIFVFVLYSYWSESRHHTPAAEIHEKEAEFVGSTPLPLWLSLLMLIGGLVGLVAGSKMLVTGSVAIARNWGVPEAVIGLSLVAIGTSLPELATSAMAAVKRETDVAIGNILGSNIFNILFILGVAAMVRPLPINPQLLSFDIWVMLLSAIILMPLLMTGWRLSRLEGSFFLVSYGGYIAILFLVIGLPTPSL